MMWAEPDEWALGVLENIRKEGFKICLLSNNNENRIKIFNRKIGAYAYWKAGKPAPKDSKRPWRIWAVQTGRP